MPGMTAAMCDYTAFHFLYGCRYTPNYDKQKNLDIGNLSENSSRDNRNSICLPESIHETLILYTMSKGDTCKSEKIPESHITLPWIDFSVLEKTWLVVTFQSSLGLLHHCLLHSGLSIEAEQYITPLCWLCTVCIASMHAFTHVIPFVFMALCVRVEFTYLHSPHPFCQTHTG